MRNRIQALLDSMAKASKRMDDPKGDGTGDGAVSPTGDDYNNLYAEVEAALKDMLTTTPERTAVEQAYFEAAKAHVEEGELELDPDAVVSVGEDSGAYVQMWKWIPEDEADLPEDDAMYACPKCESTEHLDVSINQWARITSNEVENVQTDPAEAEEHGQEWDGDSAMACRACGHTGKVREFDVTEEKQCQSK